MSDLIIPLEPLHPSDDDDDGPVAFTDFIVHMVIDNAETHEHGGEAFYDVGDVATGGVLSFAIGCAVGVEFDDRIETMLEQTRGDQVEALVEACREPMAEAAAEARKSSEPPTPEFFIGDLLDTLHEMGHADAETAYGFVGSCFEYGLIFAKAQRSTALVLRNAFDRERKADLEEPSAEADASGEPEDAGEFESLQDLAREVMAEYEEEFGFTA